MQVEFQGDRAIISKEEFFKHFGSEAAKPTEINVGKETDLTHQITDALAKFGIPRHIKGFNYLREAVILSVNDRTYIEKITKRLYPDVSREFTTTPSRVERAIRHAIEVGCSKNPDGIGQVFGRSIAVLSDKPTNGEFIATVADNIRLAKQ